MSRPTLHELCKTNSSELRLLSHEEASLKIINALKTARNDLTENIHKMRTDSASSYECIIQSSNRVKYLDKAIEARQQDYDEMMKPQFEFTSTVSRAGSFIEKCIGRLHG